MADKETTDKAKESAGDVTNNKETKAEVLLDQAVDKVKEVASDVKEKAEDVADDAKKKLNK